MSLRIELGKYKAVERADITLSDLTVLAGVNASGKSTVARIFHSVVEISRNRGVYERRYAFKQCLADDLERLCRMLDRIDDYFMLYKADNSSIAGNGCFVIRDACKQFLGGDDEHEITDSSVLFNRMIDWLDNEQLRETIDSDKRFLEGFNRTSERKVNSSLELIDWFEGIFKKYDAYLKKMKDSSFKPNVYYYSLDEREVFSSDAEASLRVEDSGVEIFDSKKSDVPTNVVLSSVRSIYLSNSKLDDMPQVVADNVALNVKIGNDKYELPDEQKLRFVRKTKKWRECLEEAWHGKLEKPKNEVNQWSFLQNGATRPIPFKQCADGIKSMATLDVLDKYGLLDQDTLLVIDEPEVHLHPQWIVAYAKMIVSLVREEHVRVLLTTHSPYLIRALRQFSVRMLKDDQLNFYLTEPTKDTNRFVFRPLHHDIAPIFKAFNVALDQIAYYQD